MSCLQNARHEQFAQELASGKSASEAYQQAGYGQGGSDAAVRACASRLLTNANVVARIHELQAETAEHCAVTREMVVAELAKIAFVNLADLCTVDDKGRLVIDPSNITRDQWAGINEVRQRSSSETTGSTQIKLRMGHKLRALELLGKMLGLFADRQTNMNPNMDVRSEPMSEEEWVAQFGYHGAA